MAVTLMVIIGWQCPACGRCYSPSVTTCPCCAASPGGALLCVVCGKAPCIGASTGCSTYHQGGLN